MAIGAGFGFLPRRQPDMARGFEQQKHRCKSPRGETSGESERERLKDLGKERIFGLGRGLLGQGLLGRGLLGRGLLGRGLLGQGLLPRRKRPAAQPQGEDAQGRRNLDPTCADRPGLGRETREDQRHGETGGRRQKVRREGASPGRTRAGEAHQSPEQQCDEKVRRHAETPRLNRRLNSN